MAEELSNAALLEQIRGGSPQAEALLVSRFARGVRLMLRRHMGEDPAAEDLYQEVFGLVLQKARDGAIRSPESLPGFIASLARNLVIAHYRREAKHRSEPIGEAADPPCTGPSAEERILLREEAERVRRVLQALPRERDRQILTRFYLAGNSKEAICRDLGIDSLHFNRVLFRAKQRYRRLYLEATAGTDPPASSAGESRRSRRDSQPSSFTITREAEAHDS